MHSSLTPMQDKRKQSLGVTSVRATCAPNGNALSESQVDAAFKSSMNLEIISTTFLRPSKVCFVHSVRMFYIQTFRVALVLLLFGTRMKVCGLVEQSLS